MHEMLDAALDYAAKGWPVLPLHSISDGRCTCGRADCPSPGKHPHTVHGVHDATRDTDQITAWWLEWPGANVGIATGTQAGLTVVDVDLRNGGFDNLADLALPDTRCVKTGSGGLHLYFLGAVRKGKLAPGIDLQGEGGYVVAPPSRHISGEDYEWISDGPLAQFPQLETAKPIAANGHQPIIVEPDRKQWVVDLLNALCPQGERNNTATRLAGYLRNLLPERVTLAVLGQWNQQCCEPPMVQHELTQLVHHKYQRYAGFEDATPTTWTAKSLLEATLPEPTWVVETLLPEGLTMLAGRPKRGKSWLALQIAKCVLLGEPVLGRQTTSGKIIYIALEDSLKRLQKRLRLMHVPASDDLIIYTSFPKLDAGGIAEMADLLEQHRPVFVVLDTLSRALSGGPDQDSTGQMTAVLDPLQKLGLAYSCAIMVVDHHRKPGMEIVDAVDDIIGSTAKTAVADAIWGLYRKSGESNGVLRATGRDLEEAELAVVWDSLHFEWRAEGDLPAKMFDQRCDTVLDLLNDVGEADVLTISKRLGLSDDSTRQLLDEMKARDLVTLTSIQTGQRGRPRFLYVPKCGRNNRINRNNDQDD